jgi:hypothetical protein
MNRFTRPLHAILIAIATVVGLLVEVATARRD